VCVYSVFVLPCVQVAALWRAHSSSKESYRLCKYQETEKDAKAQQRAVEPYIERCCIIPVHVISGCIWKESFTSVDNNFYTEELTAEMKYSVMGKDKGGYEICMKHDLCPSLWDGDVRNLIK
jgi:hypothetical protein